MQNVVSCMDDHLETCIYQNSSWFILSTHVALKCFVIHVLRFLYLMLDYL